MNSCLKVLYPLGKTSVDQDQLALAYQDPNLFHHQDLSIINNKIIHVPLNLVASKSSCTIHIV